jgi:hypothetical protein
VTDRLYIWVTNWDKFQGRTDRPGLPWFKVYSDLFTNDDYVELSSANRVLLLGLYSDTNRAGLGRVSGNIAALRSRHNVRRAALEPLIEAGFITLSTTKGAPTGHQTGTLEEKRIDKKKKKKNGVGAEMAPAAFSENGNHPPVDEDDEPLSAEEQRRRRAEAQALLAKLPHVKSIDDD